ncbi:MAG: hypothetical protein HQK78_13440 [Desulfobacterales bacterium]|nr:hypothetical protein [Desulfobacterales bacterium]
MPNIEINLKNIKDLEKINLDELFVFSEAPGGYRKEFIYLDKKSLLFDIENLTLTGKYFFNNTPSEIVPEKIVNSSDTLFIMDQAIYCFLMYYYFLKHGMSIREYNKLSDNLVCSDISMKFCKKIFKDYLNNNFTVELIKELTNKKNRVGFEFFFEITSQSHTAKTVWFLIDEGVER